MRERSFTGGAVFEPVVLDDDFPARAYKGYNVRGDVSPIPPHAHDCFEIGYCYGGAGVFTVENKILRFKEGDVSVINSRELHHMTSVRGKTCRWRFCNLDPARLLAGILPAESARLGGDKLRGESFGNIFSPDKHGGICAAVRDIIEELAEARPGCQSVVRALVWSLMVRLNRLAPQNSAEEPGAAPPDRAKLSMVRPALELMARNYKDPVSMSALAKKCGMSGPHFRRVFKAALGVSPTEYLARFRMSAAAALLKNSSEKIITVAALSGYPTLSNFNRYFKAEFGMSPREYRKRG
jgi:AraC-like DNA-binding protein